MIHTAFGAQAALPALSAASVSCSCHSTLAPGPGPRRHRALLARLDPPPNPCYNDPGKGIRAGPSRQESANPFTLDRLEARRLTIRACPSSPALQSAAAKADQKRLSRVDMKRLALGIGLLFLSLLLAECGAAPSPTPVPPGFTPLPNDTATLGPTVTPSPTLDWVQLVLRWRQPNAATKAAVPTASPSPDVTQTPRPSTTPYPARPAPSAAPAKPPAGPISELRVRLKSPSLHRAGFGGIMLSRLQVRLSHCAGFARAACRRPGAG